MTLTPWPTGHRPAASLLTLGAALLLALSQTACGDSHSAAPAASARPTAVGVQLLRAETLSLSTELPGRTSAPLAAEIRPQVGGIVTARHFTEGAAVRAGQVLYQLDAASYQTAVASAQASVAKAESVLEASTLTVKRRSELAKIDAVSQQDLQDAQAAQKQAQADLAASQATLATARLNLARTAITSPISGVVDMSSVTPGALVTADQASALTTVRQINPIQVDITQSSAELLRLKRELASGRLQAVGANEAKVTLLLEDGSRYARQGQLRFAGAVVNSSTGAVTLRAVFDNPDGLLLPGMYVRALLATGRSDSVLLVAQQAVSRSSDGTTSVLLVDAQDKVARRVITLGQAAGNRWLVRSGLAAGERVIVEGLQKVKPGELVQAQPVQLPAAAAADAVADTPAVATVAKR